MKTGRKNQLELLKTETGSPDTNQKEMFADIRNYLAGRHIGATKDDDLLKELIKCFIVRIKIERENIQKIELSMDDDLTKAANFYREIFSKAKAEFPFVVARKEEILLDPTSLMFVMKNLSKISLLEFDRDPVGDAFEIFIGSAIRGQEGQFFTPANAASVLVESISPSINETVIDPSCGAGGFLAPALKYVRSKGYNENIIQKYISNKLFGIDKDKYLSNLAKVHLGIFSKAEPNILCRDSLEWNESVIKNHNFPEPGSYDIVLANPPFGTKIKSASDNVLIKYKLAKKWKYQTDDKCFYPLAEIQKMYHRRYCLSKDV